MSIFLYKSDGRFTKSVSVNRKGTNMVNGKSYPGRPEKCKIRPGDDNRLCVNARRKGKPKCRQCTAWQEVSRPVVVGSAERRTGKGRKPGGGFKLSGVLTRVPECLARR